MLNNPKWFYGIVENVDDPLKSGLVQVRGLGVHELNKALLPSDFLPWCKVMTPATSSSTKGVGTTPTGIQVGSMALCIAMDSAYQDNRVLFTWQAGSMDENDITEIARGLTNAIIDTKLNNRNESKELGLNWSEPQTNYGNVIYPYNHATVTRAGHIIELDDTVNLERIHVLHKDGSFIEYRPGGDVVEKTMGDKYEIYRRNINRLVNGKDRKNASDVAIHKYGKTYYFKSASQATFASDTDMLFIAPSTIEFHTDVLQVIGNMKISQTLYVSEIKAARISCDQLSVMEPIEGTAKYALAATTASSLGGGTPPIVPTVQPLNIQSKLSSSDGKEGDNTDAPAGDNKASEKVSQEPGTEQKAVTDTNTQPTEEATQNSVHELNKSIWYETQIPNIAKYKYNFLTIHTTATPLNEFHDVNTIRAMHKAQGWSDIGYHVLITRTGLIQIGRPWNIMGAHVKGFNENNFAVSLVGGTKEVNGRWVGDNNFTQAQWKSLQIVITDVARLYGISPSNIKGHRDWSPDLDGSGVVEKNEWLKECPSFNVAPWVSVWWDTRNSYKPEMPTGAAEKIDLTEPSTNVKVPENTQQVEHITEQKVDEVIQELPATDVSNSVQDLSERKVQDIATNIARGILSTDVAKVAESVATLAAMNVRSDTSPMVDKAVDAKEQAEVISKKVSLDMIYFRNQYYGPSSINPAKRPDGTDPRPGDLYFNVVKDKVMVYVAKTTFIGWEPIDGGGLTGAAQIAFDNTGTVIGAQNVADAIKELANMFKTYEPQEGPSHTGDGTTRIFSSAINKKVDPQYIIVWLNGARIKPTNDYTIDTEGNIVTTAAVSTGTKLESMYYVPLQGVLPLTGGTLVGKLIGTEIEMMGTGISKIRNLHVENVTLVENTLSSSDRTLKYDIRRIKSPLVKINQIDGVEFKWKKSGRNGHGTIAQQLQHVLPSAVEKIDGYLRVDYHGLFALLIESIKAIIYRVETLEQKNKQIEELTKRIEKLENILNDHTK